MFAKVKDLSVFNDIAFRVSRSADHFVVSSVSDFSDRWSDSIEFPALDVCESEVLPGPIGLAVNRSFENPIAGKGRNSTLKHYIIDLIDLFQVDSDCNPFKLLAILESRALPPSESRKRSLICIQTNFYLL